MLWTDVREDDGPHGDETPRTVSVAVRARDQVVLGILFPSLEPRRSTSNRDLLLEGPVAVDRWICNRRQGCGNRGQRWASSTTHSSRRSSEQAAELCETPFASAARCDTRVGVADESQEIIRIRDNAVRDRNVEVLTLYVGQGNFDNCPPWYAGDRSRYAVGYPNGQTTSSRRWADFCNGGT